MVKNCTVFTPAFEMQNAKVVWHNAKSHLPDRSRFFLHNGDNSHVSLTCFTIFLIN
jgi:hypothetical protein